jgi:predicted nucleotidyltransferase
MITNPGAIKTVGTFCEGWIHEELNQDLFEGTHLRPAVRAALLQIATKFEKTLNLSLKPVDIYLTGSSANFNYNESSDIDVHLVYDFEQVGINAEILVNYFIAKKQVFNANYNIKVKGLPVEVGVENLNTPIVSTAIYSLVKDGWLIEPEYAERLLPVPDMQQYYKIVQNIENAIQSRNSKEIGKLWDELYQIRTTSLQNEGELGKGNALFKKLRNLGYLERLKKAYYSSASEELSLESLKEI